MRSIFCMVTLLALVCVGSAWVVSFWHPMRSRHEIGGQVLCLDSSAGRVECMLFSKNAEEAGVRRMGVPYWMPALMLGALGAWEMRMWRAARVRRRRGFPVGG